MHFFGRITSISQPTNAHIISHKALLKHFKTLRHVSILSDHHQGYLILAKIMLTVFTIQLVFANEVLYWHIMLCRNVLWSRCAHLVTAQQHIPTRHDMLPQHLVCKYQLNCEYCNIILARIKHPWWWSDKIETCRSVLKCFKSVLYEIICAFVGW